MRLPGHFLMHGGGSPMRARTPGAARTGPVATPDRILPAIYQGIDLAPR